MNARWKSAWAVLRQTFKEFKEDKVPRLAGALAYFSLFAMGPIILIVVSVAGLLFGPEAARGEITGTLGGVIGPQAANALESLIENAYEPRTNVLGAVVGVVLLFVAATTVFAQLKDALNTIWEVRQKPSRGWKGFVRDRLLGVAAVLGLGLVLLATLLVTAGLAVAGKHFAGALPGGALAWQAAHFVVDLAVITLIFAMVFKILPNVEIGWRDVGVGAAATALLFVLGKFAIGFYIGRRSFGDAFGAAGGLVALLVWVYFASLLLFLGAEFTQVWARRRGRRILPDENAVPLTEDMRRQEGAPHEG